jgi:hypothetical protein
LAVLSAIGFLVGCSGANVDRLFQQVPIRVARWFVLKPKSKFG